jgi:hypothetical protein
MDAYENMLLSKLRNSHSSATSKKIKIKNWKLILKKTLEIENFGILPDFDIKNLISNINTNLEVLKCNF